MSIAQLGERDYCDRCKAVRAIKQAEAAIALMRGQSEPSRETLAGLLAAMYYAQWSTHEDKKRIECGIESALRDFDIGLHKFVTTTPKDPADEQ
jgi:hypothetical protein